MGDQIEDQWSAANTIKQFFEKIADILKNPNISYALDTTIASEQKSTPEVYKQKTLQSVKDNANKTVDELLASVLGAGVQPDSDIYKEKKLELTEWITKYKKAFWVVKWKIGKKEEKNFFFG